MAKSDPGLDPENFIWTVDAQAIARKPGDAMAAIVLSNPLVGAVRFNVAVDWQPGQEAVDVEAFALSIVDVLIASLLDSIRTAAAKRADGLR